MRLSRCIAIYGLLLFSATDLMLPSTTSGQHPEPAYKDSSVPLEKRLDDLVSRMTLEEKVSQMMNAAPAIPRLGIPEYDWWNEALHGVAFSAWLRCFRRQLVSARRSISHSSTGSHP